MSSSPIFYLPTGYLDLLAGHALRAKGFFSFSKCIRLPGSQRVSGEREVYSCIKICRDAEYQVMSQEQEFPFFTKQTLTPKSTRASNNAYPE